MAATLDYETTQSYVVVVEVASSNITGSLTLTIVVTNVLENLTVSDDNGETNSIEENASMSTAVSGLDLVALDEDDRQFEAVWSLSDDADGVFAINSASGAISLATTTLDYESATSYAIVVQGANETASITSSLTLTIAVIDLLETLTVTDTNVANNTILTSANLSDTVEGLELSVASESAALDNTSVTWDVSDDNNYFMISADGVVTPATSLVGCLLYTSPSPRDRTRSRMPSSA